MENKGTNGYLKIFVSISFYTMFIYLFGCSNPDNLGKENSTLELDGSKSLQLETAPTILENWSKRNIVVAHIQGDPDNLHPLNGSSAFGRILNLYLHGYLIVPDPAGELGYAPGIVQSLPTVSGNGQIYTYKLREGISWDDGSDVTVQDIVFSYKTALCPLVNNPHYKPYAKAIRSIVVDSIDHRVFHLHMLEPNIQNAEIPTLFPILQEKVWDTNLVLRKYSFEDLHSDADVFNDDEQIREWASTVNDWSVGRDPSLIVGLGPYQLTDWKYDQSLTLSLKEDQWSQRSSTIRNFDKGFPETILFRVNRDPNSTELEFKSQIYDASSNMSEQTFSSLLENEVFNRNYHAVEVTSFSYSYLAFNLRPNGVTHQKLFTDNNVRKAIAHAVPYHEINKLAHGNNSTRQIGPVSPLKDEHNNQLKAVNYDLVKAKQLLDEAGWTDTDGDNTRDKIIDGETVEFSFTLNYTVSPKHQELIAELISESLNEIGIKCELHPITFALLGEKKRSHDFDAYLSAWAMSATPQDFTQIWHSESWSNGGSNYIGFGSAKSDALIDSIRTTIDSELRNKLSKRFQQLVYKEQPYVFLFGGTKRIVAHKRFNNVTVFNDRPHVMLNQWKLIENSVASFDE